MTMPEQIFIYKNAFNELTLIRHHKAPSESYIRADIAQSRIDVLERALRRFASIKADDNDNFSSYPDDCIIRCEITVGDLREAKEALQDAEVRG